MKTLLAAVLLATAAGAFAQGSPFEIRFHPGERVYAYPLDEQGRYRSVQLQNAVVINRTGEPIALASIDLELVAPPSAVEARVFDGDELERVAKAGYILQSSGLMEMLRFQFGGEALVPRGVTFAQGAVLHYFGAAIGLGMIVIGAALGIGRFASAAAEGIARQPAAAEKITGAVNLPLFLLEGVAILAEVFVLLLVLMW